jgi:hypothetical protein
MTRRRLAAWWTGRTGCTVGAFVGLSLLAWAAPSAQPRSQTSSTRRGGADVASGWTAPRTADGQPDLQGVWISRSATPLERPKALEGKAHLTDDEVAELKRRAERIFKDGNSDFAAGDAVFLAALENRQQFKSATSTHGAEEMVEREFDNHTSLVTDPADGRIPPLTPEGRRRLTVAAAAAQHPAGPEDLNPAHRCISWSVPRLGGRYGAGDLSYYQIVQSPGFVVIHFETGHDARIIPLDGRPHLPSSQRLWNGDSRGRWEGATLVVDTTNFSNKSSFMGAAEGLHLVERFTRVAADTIRYEMTIDDPTTWEKPWSAEIPLKQTAQQLFEYACHEGNDQMMIGLLKVARTDDAAAAAKIGR